MRKLAFACLMLALSAGCREQVIEEFTVSGQTLDHWLEQLQSATPSDREKAVQALSNVGAVDDRVIPALIDVLQDENPLVRGKAVLALLKIGPEADSAVEPLNDLARNDTDAEVRRYAESAVRVITGAK